MFFIFFTETKRQRKLKANKNDTCEKAASEQRLLKGMPKFSIGGKRERRGFIAENYSLQAFESEIIVQTGRAERVNFMSALCRKQAERCSWQGSYFVALGW